MTKGIDSFNPATECRNFFFLQIYVCLSFKIQKMFAFIVFDKDIGTLKKTTKSTKHDENDKQAVKSFI